MGKKQTILITISRQFGKAMTEPWRPEIPVSRQCELIGLSKAAYYYRPRPMDALNETLMRLPELTRTTSGRSIDKGGIDGNKSGFMD